MKQPDTIGLKVGDYVEYEQEYYGSSRRRAKIYGRIHYIGTLESGIIRGKGPVGGSEHAYLIKPIEVTTYPHGECDEVSYADVIGGYVQFTKVEKR